MQSNFRFLNYRYLYLLLLLLIFLIWFLVWKYYTFWVWSNKEYICFVDCRRDTDLDWVFDILEDINSNWNLFDDDSDNDGIPDFLDKDDDGDSVLTKLEDPNNDWNPYNDDSDGDGISNYLDPDANGNGVLDIQEILKNSSIDKVIIDDLLHKISMISPISNNSDWSKYLALIYTGMWSGFINDENIDPKNYNNIDKYNYGDVLNNSDDREIIYKYIYNYIYWSWNWGQSGQNISIIYIYTGNNNTWSNWNTWWNNTVVISTGSTGNAQNNDWWGGTADPLKPYAEYFRCSNPFWWTAIEHGKSIFAYENDTVNYPEACKWESRVCNNGTLWWSYTSKTCIQIWNSCTAPRWSILKHGQIVKWYSDNMIDFGANCGDFAKNLQCLDGVIEWSNKYIYDTCKNEVAKVCTWPDGKTYPHNQIATYYKYSKVVWEPKDGEDICPRQARLCNNGARYNLDRTQKIWFTYSKNNCIAAIE